MGKFNFDEYRQPWETGPHWELKREFMEKYQNDFSEDRLLCLAQAYSNIELMNCRYPDPVMLQVHELAKSLHGCRRFREANRILEAGRNAAKNKKGKRKLTDEDSQTPYKFIKFCSASSSNEKKKQSTISSCNEVSTIDFTCINEPGCSASLSNEKNLQSIPSCDEVLAIDPAHVNEPVCSYDQNRFDNGVNFDSKPMDIKELKTDINNSNFIFLIPVSQDLKLIKQIADEIKKSDMKKKHNRGFEKVISKSDVKFEFVTIDNACLCKFYIGNTLVSLGRDNNERNARIKAIEYAIEVLDNLCELPSNSLDSLKDYWVQEDLKMPLKFEECNTEEKSILNTSEKGSVTSKKENMLNKNESNKSSLQFWLTFAESIKKYVGKNLAAKEIINAAAKLVNIKNISYFNFTEDMNSSLHNRTFCCDLVIEKTLICQGKSTSKRKSTSNAAENGVLCLLNFIHWCKEQFKLVQEPSLIVDSMNVHQNSLEKSSVAMTDTSICNEENEKDLNKKLPLFRSTDSDKVSSVAKKKKKNTQISNTEKRRMNTINKFKSSLTDEAPENFESSDLPSSSECAKTPTESLHRKPIKFTLNKILLNNSYQRGLVLFDTSDVRSICQQTPASKLNFAASFCHKVMKYEEIPPPLGKQMFRGHVIFDGEEIGVGEATTKSEAKVIATYCAFEHLRKLVYTVKVKNELEDGFVISRNQVMNVNVPSDALSDTNIGCKMLKMMGWSGGGIGKTGGITEPIAASEPRFKQGLGFTKKGGTGDFKRNINALLTDFSQSNSTGDLIFSTDFSKEERKEIHRIAKVYNLTSNSHGKDNRQLFLKRKITVTELLNALVKAEGSTSKYELVDNSM